MNAVQPRLRIWSSCGWLAMKCNGLDGVYTWSSSDVLRLVDNCVDVSYAPASSAGMVWRCSGWRVAKACRYCRTCLFEISGNPCVCGWNTIDMSSLVCNLSLTSVQKSEMNRVSLSHMIPEGTLLCHLMASTNNCSNSAPSMVLVHPIGLFAEVIHLGHNAIVSPQRCWHVRTEIYPYTLPAA